MSKLTGTTFEDLTALVEKVAPLCRHCNRPIEKFTDPWGKFIEWVHVGEADYSWEGEEEGWVGTNGRGCPDESDNVADPVHNHRCFLCSAKLECEPDDCVITNEQLICPSCDWRSR